jgi:hypothetical protein
MKFIIEHKEIERLGQPYDIKSEQSFSYASIWKIVL